MSLISLKDNTTILIDCNIREGDEDSDGNSGVGGGDVLGISTESGQVLGITSYADTGEAEELITSLMAMGGVLVTGVGVIGYKKNNEG